MTVEKCSAYAVIQVTVEVEAPGTYDGTATMEFLYRQCGREAMEVLRGLLAGRAKIIGDPKVQWVVAETSK